MYPRNAASPQRISIGAVVQISDGAVQTSGVAVKVLPHGGTEASGGGTISYTADGVVCYVPTQAETNYTSFILTASKSGCIPADKTVITTASDVPGYGGVDWSKVNAPTTSVGLSGTTISTSQQVASVSGAVGSVTGNVGGNVSGSVASVTTGVTVTTNNDKSGYSLATAPPTASAIADAVWDEAYSGHTTAGTFGKLMDIMRKSNLSIDGTVTTTVTPTTTAFTTNVSATTGAYEHSVLLFTTGALVGQNSPILTFTSTNGAIVVEEAFTEAPSNGDEFIIVAASHVHSIAGIQSGLALAADLATLDDKVDTIDGLIDQLIAEIVTSQSMPGQGAPPATLKLATAIMYLYKQFRNKKTQTNSEYKLFADDGSTVDQKSTVSDDGTTTTVGEMDTGA